MGARCPGSTWAKPLYSKRASYPTGRAVRPPTAARSRPRPGGRVLDASPDESRGIALGYATEFFTERLGMTFEERRDQEARLAQ